MNSFLLFFVGLAIFSVSLVGGTFLNGWVLNVLWQWFIVETFGLPAISLGQAIGLGMIVNFLTYQYQYQSLKAPENNNFSTVLTLALFLGLFRPLFVVAIAWLVRHFVA